MGNNSSASWVRADLPIDDEDTLFCEVATSRKTSRWSTPRLVVEARVVVVGIAGTGKSAFARKLRDGIFTDDPNQKIPGFLFLAPYLRSF